MSNQNPTERAEEEPNTNGNLTFTRRTAMALLGVGATAGVASSGASADHGAKFDPTRRWNQHVDAQNHDLENLHSVDTEHVFTAARTADRIVWQDDDGTYHADGRNGGVASGEEFVPVVQSALDSLTDGRTHKERVLVAANATVGVDDSAQTIEVPSYTVLDVPGSIHVEYPKWDSSNILIRAEDESHIEIPRLTVTGAPWMAIRLRSCSDIRLDDIEVLFARDSDANDALRIDNGGESEERSTDIQIGSAYIENGTQHSVETYGVDRIQIQQVMAKYQYGCAVLLNDTSDATIDSIMGYNPVDESVGAEPQSEDDLTNASSRYATFRVTYPTNNVSVGQVVSRGAPRGLHIHSGGTGDISIGEVTIKDAETPGVMVTDPNNVVINGGVIKNCTGEGIRVHAYDPYPGNARGITLSDLRVYDDQDEPTQAYGIRETGDYVMNNRIVDCDVRDGGVEANIAVTSESTTVADNVGGGIASGTVTLESGSEPAARVEGVSEAQDVTLDLRAKTFDGPDSALAWDHHFAWTGDQWDLVIEWRTDPGEDVTLDYIVDRPQANIGRYPIQDESSGDGPAT